MKFAENSDWVYLIAMTYDCYIVGISIIVDWTFSEVIVQKVTMLYVGRNFLNFPETGRKEVIYLASSCGFSKLVNFLRKEKLRAASRNWEWVNPMEQAEVFVLLEFTDKCHVLFEIIFKMEELLYSGLFFS